MIQSSPETIKTPVVFLVFNRPDHTARVFAAIRKARPEKLLIVADGPRADRPEDKEKCLRVREIVKRIDWDCEVLTRFSENNLGCAEGVASGITWAFENVETAIILEDDCLPESDFFRFCDELIPRYKDDPRVGMITGCNFGGPGPSPYSYHFSRLGHIWGWATWRSSWTKYDRNMSDWPAVRDGKFLNEVFENKKIARFWTANFDAVHGQAGGVQMTWDYQWFYATLINNWLAVMPTENLITNIGFDAEATHTRDKANFPMPDVGRVKFPLVHPPALIPLLSLDSRALRRIMGIDS